MAKGRKKPLSFLGRVVGHPMLWDFTCPDTLAPSHLSKTSVLAGAAASEAEVRKTTKYSNFIHSHIFIPVAIENRGVWWPGAIASVKALGHRLQEASRDPQSEFFLRQRIDIAVLRGNALSVRGTFPAAAFAGWSSTQMNVDDAVERLLLWLHS